MTLDKLSISIGLIVGIIYLCPFAFEGPSLSLLDGLVEYGQ